MERLKKLLPNNWQSAQFDKVFEFIPTLTLSRDDLTTNDSDAGIYNIHYGDIHSTYKFVNLDFIKEKKIPKITKLGIDDSKLSFLKDGDIVIADASEDYEGVASCVELSNVEERKVTAGLHTFAARDKNGFTSDGFRAYLLKHPWVSNELKKLATGSKVYGVSKTNIGKLELVLPPLPEQQKIAAILSKWDELIDSQTQLIEAKEKQKTNLMQKLLTGKVRFPGFEEEIEEVPLETLSWYQEGPGLRKWQFKLSGIKVINITNIIGGFLDLTKTDRHISIEEFEKKYKHFLIDEGDIVVASSGNSFCKHGVVRKQDLPLIMNTSVIRFKPLDNCSYNYLNQFLKSPFFKTQIDILITGGAQPNFGPAHLAEVLIPYPSFEEQEKIGETLEKMDEELNALNVELENFRKQKKGLMQQLLTGKIRVNV